MDGVISTETQPTGLLGGLSWRVILATALSIVTASGLLWLLGSGIALVATTHDSLDGGFVAICVIAFVVTLIAAAIGGLLAGWLVRDRRRGGLHATLGCALAFLFVTGALASMTGGVLRTGGSLALQTAQTTAATGVTAGRGNVAVGAVRFLEGLGYTNTEARTIVGDAQRSIQRTINPQTSENANARATAGDAANALLHNLGAIFLLYMGTWILALLLAGFCGVECEALLTHRSLVFWRRHDVHGRRNERLVTSSTTLPPQSPLRPREEF